MPKFIEKSYEIKRRSEKLRWKRRFCCKILQLFKRNSTYKKVFLVFFLSGVVILMLSILTQHTVKLLSTTAVDRNTPTRTQKNRTSSKYLVSNPKCRIPYLEPFSKDAVKFYEFVKYENCSNYPLLTYVSNYGTSALVHVNDEVIQYYTDEEIECCYANITRGISAKIPDNAIRISECENFHDSIAILTDAIAIQCFESTESLKKIYENVHTAIRLTANVEEKVHKWKRFRYPNIGENQSYNQPLSVLMVGIDSVSRLNFIRTMPKTHDYVIKNGWLTLEGYNMIDDNTFPNLMAMFTGFNGTQVVQICKPQTMGGLDKCPLLWYDFRNLGYITGYAEDEFKMSTFNHNKTGFKEPPVDYYFRPYVIATEILSSIELFSMKYCSGPETTGERIMNLIKKFALTFLFTPKFGFFWMNSFSHAELNAPQMMDEKVKNLFTELEKKEIYNNTVVIFLSDHGIRYGNIRMTETGWLEERLPFIYFSFPPWFKQKVPMQYQNLIKNKNRLTTPYDLYMTLQDIMVLSNLDYTVRPSEACPKCQSLFEEVPFERSCEDAAIDDYCCTCSSYTETRIKRKILDKFKKKLEKVLNKLVAKNKKCAEYIIVDHLSTRLSDKFAYKHKTHLIIIVKTSPEAYFETTFIIHGHINSRNYTIGPISRLDNYRATSECVDDYDLKKYCYCIERW